ncbi:hypothetical protein MKX01_038857 [Papaver californicum]|nr:hypothetical protein MKX01_038857 [Papaver californicum]
MATELEELLGFLSSPLPQVKKAAVDIVRDLTGSQDGVQRIIQYSDIAVPALARLLGENKEVSVPAAEALVNLSENPRISAKMVEIGMGNIVMDMLYKKYCVIARLLVMILVNLTQLDAGITSLLQIGEEKVEGLYVMKLVRSFRTSSDEKALAKFCGVTLHSDTVACVSDDPFAHIGFILVNISKMEAGWRFC